MTTTPQNPDDRDEVLVAFNQACPVPTAEQILDWCNRFPAFADDIRDHAAISRDWAAEKGGQTSEIDETTLAQGFSRVLNLLHEADKSSIARSGAGIVQTFQQAMDVCGSSVPTLAEQVGITRAILSDLVNGRMLPPVGARFLAAVTQQLRISEAAFHEYLQRALDSPKMAHARSDGLPSVVPRSYDAIIRESSMPDDKKKFWLDED